MLCKHDKCTREREKERETREGNVDFTSNGMCTAETCNFQECVAVENKTDKPSTRSRII